MVWRLWGNQKHSHPLDATPRPAEGGIALERVPGEAEKVKRREKTSQKHGDGFGAMRATEWCGKKV